MPSATFTPNNIAMGPGLCWIGCAVPATGSRLLIDANGNPTQGAPVCPGGTDGALTLSIGPKYQEESFDQVTGPVAVLMISEANEIDVTMKEATLLNLSKSLAIGLYATGTDGGLPAGAQNYEELSFGGLQQPTTACIAIIAARRDAVGKFAVSCLYNAYAQDPIPIAFDRSKPILYKVKFKGLNVPGRPAGDQTGKIYRQT